MEQSPQLIALENQKLRQVLNVSSVISSSLELNVVLDSIMEKARELMDAEASSLMLVDESTDELYFHVIKGEKSDVIKQIRLKLGEGIAGWVAEHGEPVLLEDCSDDPRFSNRADNLSSFVTRSMISVPLKFKGRVLGTVQVLNKKDNQLFTKHDLMIFSALAGQAAIALENARLHRMATIDGMTGLYMKHYFLARLKDEFRRAKHDHGYLSVIMSDIDFFKKVNDNYGHQGGDAALVELAQIILEAVDSMGQKGHYLPGRYGGEEFCVLLPGADKEEAWRVGERIRSRVESTPVPIGDDFAHITISVGVSSYPLHRSLIESEDDFIRIADEALYICKRRGRNVVALYEVGA